MPVNVIITDAEVAGFSDHAKTELETGVKNFAVDLISEANRVETGRRGQAGVADVGANDIREALPIVRRREVAKKAGLGPRLVRIFAAVFALILGLIWDKASLQSTAYLIAFFLLFAVTILLVIFAALED